MMSFEEVIKGNGMKVQVITLKSKKLDSGEYEVTEKYSSIYRNEVACLYKDRNGVYILLKKGILVKVKHSLSEMESYFLGDLKPHERTY